MHRVPYHVLTCLRDLLMLIELIFTKPPSLSLSTMTTTVYSGSLQPKKKAELREIALALRINDTGTKEEVQHRIRKHLDDNQATLEDDPAFSGLFTRRKRTVPQSIHPYVSLYPCCRYLAHSLQISRCVPCLGIDRGVIGKETG